MGLTNIGPKHQVTIPKTVFERLKLDVGDYLDVEVKGATITMVPKKLIPKDQAWFYTVGVYLIKRRYVQDWFPPEN